MKPKTTAGLLALFFGSLGLHKFYLNKPIKGLLYILFSWTAVPFIISVVEGIKYLTMDEKKFNKIFKFKTSKT